MNKTTYKIEDIKINDEFYTLSIKGLDIELYLPDTDTGIVDIMMGALDYEIQNCIQDLRDIQAFEDNQTK